MTVYKRSELTPDVLRQWQREAEATETEYFNNYTQGV